MNSNNKKPLIFIAGMCVIEDLDTTFTVAKTLKEIASKYPVEFIFKASFDKANRTSIRSFRGLGFAKGMSILATIKDQLGVKILTDVHTEKQAEIIGKENVIDVIQIPAFLCRQTDLIIAASNTEKIINIKKGQFVAPQDVINIVEKVEVKRKNIIGNTKILITERGSCFGYNNLVVDYRSFLIMKKFGHPIIYDCTHSQQMPSAKGNETGGNRDFVIPMALGAIATGVDGLFLECHPEPPKAKSDRATSLYLKDVETLLKKAVTIRKTIS